MNNQDDIIRGYSPQVMWRLLGYLKSYRGVAALALCALIIATVAELLTPIVMRRTLDDNLLHREYMLDLSAVKNGNTTLLESKELLKNGRIIAGSLFVPVSTLKNLSRTQKAAAKKSGWLNNAEWYIFPNSDLVKNIVAAHPSKFLSSNLWHAIRIADQKQLSLNERRAIRADDRSHLLRRSGQYLALLLTVLIFSFGQVYAASWLGQKIMADIRKQLLSHIMSQSLHYLGRTPVGSLVSRTANDVETIAEFFTNVAISFLKDIAIMGGVIAVLFSLDSRLAWISLSTLVPTMGLLVIFRNHMREAFRRVRARISAVNSFLSEHISGMSTVQLFDDEKRSSASFGKKGRDLLNTEMQQMRIMAVFRPLIDLIASAAVALIIWYSTGLHESGLLTLGVLIAFIELIGKFFNPVKDIAEKFNILQSAMAGSERIFAMLDEKDQIPENLQPLPITESLRGEITFNDVHFSYVPGEPVLKGLSFTIQPGSTVAVVGPTGAGKTTIANLMTRLWDVDSGSIHLDGQDLRQYALSDLRKIVQPVQQDTFLFAGSIAANIDLGTGMNRKQIEDAAALARADKFIHRLSDGYDTLVTEGAGNLSAGQRQLIAFTRIIAHDPRVIILDEATANVDAETENLLQEGLESLLNHRTSLIIAHRLATVRRADHILVLGNGRVMEYGTHEELFARNGIYHNLCKLQFKTTP